MYSMYSITAVIEKKSDSFSVYLKPLCGNASFILRSDRAALARKVRTEERRSVATEIHFSSLSVFSLFLSLFARSVPLALGYVSVIIRTAVFPPCAPPPRSGVFFDLSRPPSLQAPLLDLFPYLVVLLCRAFFHNDLSSHYPLPSLYIPLLLLLLQLASSSSSSSASSSSSYLARLYESRTVLKEVAPF